jgi:hypothetical protein
MTRYFLSGGGMAALGVLLAALWLTSVKTRAESTLLTNASSASIVTINPPEAGFYAKRLDYEGIAIKAATNVVDEALFAAQGRLALMLGQLPDARAKLRAAGAELHIIGRNQVTTDLPEWRQDKGKPLAEYNGLTRDERTRGMGGLHASCGEENLLKLQADRYLGRDICVHEFAHTILDCGVTDSVREKFLQQMRHSLAKGLWVDSYAASNSDEFFAELTMWYFGTHGDLRMKGNPPANGPDGLKRYDPQAFALFAAFFSGQWESAVTNAPVTGLNLNK